jgi:2Fe-2S ferredoxin
LPKVTFVLANGEKKTVEARAGDSVMMIAVANSVPGIIAECGGAMSCATCHCYVDADWAPKVGPAEDMESDMLEYCETEVKPNSRLSCQISMSDDLDGLVVAVP